MHIHSFNRQANVPEMLSSMERAGVYGGCVFSNWPKEANAAVGTSFEERLNEVLEISGASNGRIFPVLWIHPYEENIIQKVRIAKDAGVRAFKIICTDFYVYEPPVLNLLRPSFFRNMRNMLISVLVMYAVGIYCNVAFEALVSPEAAYDVNSMFIIHSPFEGVSFLRYPIIAVVGLLIYLVIFTVCDAINMPRGQRWFNRLGAAVRGKK
jgi:hypothetical protein